MTQQFKFGDHVRYKDNENPVFGVVLEEANPGNGLITVQFIDDAEPELVGSEDLEYVPYPDTERIDWLAAQDDISITFGNAINLKLPDLRTAIDIAMQACIEAVAIKFAAHFEEMVARGEAERLPDGRYRIFEKAT